MRPGLIAMKEQRQIECFANDIKQSGKTRLQQILRVWFKKLFKVCAGICFCLPVLAWAEYKIGLAVWSGYPESVAGFKDSLVKDGIRLSQVSSELQDPPLFLVNKNSLQILGISLSVEAQKRIRYIDPIHIE